MRYSLRHKVFDGVFDPLGKTPVVLDEPPSEMGFQQFLDIFG